MGRTIRRNRIGKKEQEGRYTLYKCRCSYCLGKSRQLDKQSKDDFKKQLEDMNITEEQKESSEAKEQFKNDWQNEIIEKEDVSSFESFDWANDMTTTVICNTDNPDLCESCSG